MIAILTADVVNSSSTPSTTWLPALEQALEKFGTTPKHWQIYRGDSFQLKVAPKQALEAAYYLKANIKANSALDLRIAIGLGTETYKDDKITQSNGSAYNNSGNCFEGLQKQTLAVKTAVKAIDEPLNIMLNLAMLTANHWADKTAQTIAMALEHPKLTQVQLAKYLGKSQSSISEALKRGGFDEIMQIHNYYLKRLEQL